MAKQNKVTPSRSMDIKWMRLALVQAQLAFQADEVPVGAVVVYQNQIIGVGHNLKEKTNQVTAHAELIAIQQASEYLHSWRLDGCTLYVTLEPCMMCTGALIQSRISRIVYGASDEKSGAMVSQIQIDKLPRLAHRPLVQGQVLTLESQAILRQYFSKKRHEAK